MAGREKSAAMGISVLTPESGADSLKGQTDSDTGGHIITHWIVSQRDRGPIRGRQGREGASGLRRTARLPASHIGEVAFKCEIYALEYNATRAQRVRRITLECRIEMMTR